MLRSDALTVRRPVQRQIISRIDTSAHVIALRGRLVGGHHPPCGGTREQSIAEIEAKVLGLEQKLRDMQDEVAAKEARHVE